MAENRLIVGVDFGTDSVRAVVLNAVNGKEEASEVSRYRRWAEGRYCNPAKNRFRQHPLDYVEGLEASVKGALAGLGGGAGARVAAIGIDTTGSTPCAVDRAGRPLALAKGFEENPNAMFVLWKDHTAVREAEEINAAARSWGGTDFTKYEGGVYSSEWFWSKILHVLREDPAVRGAAFSWVEHCDWMPALLTGTEEPLSMKRSRCAAGHKAMWHAEWNGLPPEGFLAKLDPLLAGLRARLYADTQTSDRSAGGLTADWAARLGMKPGTPVAVGAFDAHTGGVGGQIEEKALVKIMGTSTCDMMVAPASVIGTRTVAGICGQVDGSIVPGMIGLEAGQSAYGDVYAWFRSLLSWPLSALLAGSPHLDREKARRAAEEAEDRMLGRLEQEASLVDPKESSVIALDWLNGRRTPFADQALKGALLGLTLGTTAPAVYRALVEATAYGARAIVEQFRSQGVPIETVIALGGIPQKSPFAMQTAADVLAMPIRVVAAEQACALGAAMLAAVAAGLYPDVRRAQKGMGGGFSRTYQPDPARVKLYDGLYAKYKELGAALERPLRGL